MRAAASFRSRSMDSGSFSPQISQCQSVNMVIKPINGDKSSIENSNGNGSVTKVEEVMMMMQQYQANMTNMMQQHQANTTNMMQQYQANMTNMMQQYQANMLNMMQQEFYIMQQQMQLLLTMKNMMPINATPPPPNNNVVLPRLNPLETAAMNPLVNDDGWLSKQCRDSYPLMLPGSPDPKVAEDCLRFPELLRSSTSDQMASINQSTTDLSLYQGRKYSNEFGGFVPLNPLATNKNSLTLGPMDWRKTSRCSLKGNEAIIEHKSDIEEVIPAHKFEEGDVAPAADDLFVDNGKFDLDCPTEVFNSIADAIEDIRQGKFTIVVDDENRENEGDLIMAASLVTPKDMAFLVKHGTGIVCVSMKEENLKWLQLPLMVAQKENEEKLSTAFTVSVDAKEGTTTGVSAKDRAKTILTLASRDSEPEDFKRPGHIFPSKYREGGVLKRAGHTEASVDLAVLAGLDAVGALCETVDDDDGSMARLPKLREFATKENLKLISIADLIRCWRKRDKSVERSAHAPVPTELGLFQLSSYQSQLDRIEHIGKDKAAQMLPTRRWTEGKTQPIQSLPVQTIIPAHVPSPPTQGSSVASSLTRRRVGKLPLEIPDDCNVPIGINAYPVSSELCKEVGRCAPLQGARSMRAKKARSQLPDNHTCGSRSFPATMSIMAVKNDGEKPHTSRTTAQSQAEYATVRRHREVVEEQNKKIESFEMKVL